LRFRDSYRLTATFEREEREPENLRKKERRYGICASELATGDRGEE
jgi:hypothetical protein